MPQTQSSIFSFSQLRKLGKFGACLNRVGVNFAVFDSTMELVVFCQCDAFHSNKHILKEAAERVPQHYLDTNRKNRKSRLHRFGAKHQILSVRLGYGTGSQGVALIDLGEPALLEDANRPRDENGAQSTESLKGTEKPPQRQSVEILAEMLGFLSESFDVAENCEAQIEEISNELSQVYEELVLLHKLSNNMLVNESDNNYFQIACDSLTDIISVEGIAILVQSPLQNGSGLKLVAGAGLIQIDDHMSHLLYDRLEQEIARGRQALLDSEVDSPFRYQWPSHIRNIIAVPLCGKDESRSDALKNLERLSMQDSDKDEEILVSSRPIGLMVAVNQLDKPDFDSIDVKLFNSVATSCAVFMENGRLFNDLKGLFIGSLKALTSSIDAKDKYTRGHSERVGYISRWIAEQLSRKKLIEKEQIDKIYLSGLLHDIGKMGISEVVLRKKAKLSSEEFAHIKLHPSIGAGILSEIRQMREIVPGVLYHHERQDGKGYPDGLTGDQIPLMAKIIGLADSFDAMTSRRVYRRALTVEESLDQIRDGLGTQFDETVGKAFLDSDIYRLWDVLQGESRTTNVDDFQNYSEYGLSAVGSLIR